MAIKRQRALVGSTLAMPLLLLVGGSVPSRTSDSPSSRIVIAPPNISCRDKKNE